MGTADHFIGIIHSSILIIIIVVKLLMSLRYFRNIQISIASKRFECFTKHKKHAHTNSSRAHRFIQIIFN